VSAYVEILAIQRPFPLMVDDNNRTVFAVNFQAEAQAPVEKWEEEIAKVLSDAGLATLGTNCFIGPAAVIPTGTGPFIQIIDSGGRSPDETHNGSKYERLSAQITVRATSYGAARTRALAIWRALDGKRNVTVTAA
jgi:hypothetical protein